MFPLKVNGFMNNTERAKQVNVEQLHPTFAARVTGIDLREPLDAASVAEIVAAMDRYAVCVFPHPEPLTNEAHIAFSRHLGPMQPTPILKVTGEVKLHDRVPYPEIINVSNLDENGNIYPDTHRKTMFRRADQQWHADVTFNENRATYSALSARIVPPGADTQYADMRAAYAALPPSMKEKIADLVAEHSVWYSKQRVGFPEPTEEELRSAPPARHPLVHVRAGQTSLYVASHASHIIGMPVDEGRALLAELTAFATQPQFVHSHAWTVGDVVIWDNLAVMHRAPDYADLNVPRELRRTTMRERPFTEAGTLGMN
jgi:alpha-ketoglutarate-dependent 2,4-dichlorophenoxyacetate dioxygenase